MSKEARKISKFSGEIYVLQTRLENFALYKPACSTASLVLKSMKATLKLRE